MLVHCVRPSPCSTLMTLTSAPATREVGSERGRVPRAAPSPAVPRLACRGTASLSWSDDSGLSFLIKKLSKQYQFHFFIARPHHRFGAWNADSSEPSVGPTGRRRGAGADLDSIQSLSSRNEDELEVLWTFLIERYLLGERAPSAGFFSLFRDFHPIH